LLAAGADPQGARHRLRVCRVVRCRDRADRGDRHLRLRRERHGAQARFDRPDHRRGRRPQRRGRVLMTPPATRARSAPGGRLLAAAAGVVRREGARGLTLDAVAREAGVSKGGLLYHFPTKRELVRGLVADWMDGFEAEVERDAEPEGAGGWT